MGSALPVTVTLSASVRTVFVPESAGIAAPPAAVKGLGVGKPVCNLYGSARGELSSKVGF